MENQHHEELSAARFGRFALVIVLLFAVVRIIFFRQLQASPLLDLLTLDSQFYYEWAGALKTGYGHPPGPFWLSPLYPVAMALLFMVTGNTSIELVVICQFLLSCGTLILLMLLTRRLFGAAAALVTGALAVLYSPWLYYDGVLLSAGLILFLNTLLLYLLVSRRQIARHWGRSGFLVYGLLGLVCGLSALGRPSVLIFGTVLVIWLWLSSDKGVRLLRVGLFAGGVVLVLLPVLIRNWYVSGSLIFTTSSGGVNFFIGNRSGASGVYDQMDFVKSFDAWREAEGYRAEASEAVGHRLSLTGASRFWFQQAVRDIAEDPIDWIRLLLKKLWLTLQNEELATNLSFRGVVGFSPILKSLPIRWGLLFPLAAGGLFFAFRRRSADYHTFRRLILQYGIPYIAVNLIFFSASEYRFPMIVLLLPAAGLFLVELWRRIKHKDYSPIVISSFIYVIVLVIVNFPSETAAKISRPRSDYFNLAVTAKDRGMTVDALPLYARSLSIDPDFQDARIGLADILWELGNFDEARREYAIAGVAPPDSIMGSPLYDFLDHIQQYIDNNQLDSALAALDESFPWSREAPAAVWVMRAQIEEALGLKVEAYQSWERASLRDAESPEWHLQMGRLAEESAQLVLADSLYRESLQRYPAFAPSRLALGFLAMKRDDWETAREQLTHLKKIQILDEAIKAQVDSLEEMIGAFPIKE